MDEKHIDQNLSKLQNISTEKINRLENRLIELVKTIERQGEAKEEQRNVFYNLFLENLFPNITREDLLDDNFCKKHENKYVQSLYRELKQHTGLYKVLQEMTGDFLVSSELEEKKNDIQRICNYSGFEVLWEITENDELILTTRDFQIYWDSPNYITIEFKNSGLHMECFYDTVTEVVKEVVVSYEEHGIRNSVYIKNPNYKDIY